MDMPGVIVILLVACLILISIVLGLALGVLLVLRRRNTQDNNHVVGSAKATSEVTKLEQPVDKILAKLVKQTANIHEHIQGESMRQLILTLGGIAIGMAIVLLISRTNPVGGTLLAIAGLVCLVIAVSFPGRWLIRKIRFVRHGNNRSSK